MSVVDSAWYRSVCKATAQVGRYSLIVRIPFEPALWTCIEDGAAFVRRSQLLSVVSNFLAAAVLARLIDGSIGLHVGLGKLLDIRS